MRYRDVVGQEKIKRQLRQFITSGRMPHALMLSSPPGRGKLALAISTARYLSCDNPGALDACDDCPTCQKYNKLMHPDLHFTFPVVKKGEKARKDTYSDHFMTEWRQSLMQSSYLRYSDWLAKIKAENRQGDINARECQEIIKKLSLKSFTGKPKILIVWKAEMLGSNANRLLKIIEEPPDNSYLIFLVDNPDFVLNTILSRFQIISVPPIDSESIKHYMIDKHQLESNTAEQICFRSEGNILDAIHMASMPSSNPAKSILDWFRICHQANPEDLLDWSNRYSNFSKEEQKQLLQYGLYVLRGLLQMEYMKPGQMTLTRDEIDLLTNMKKVMTLEKIKSISDILSESILGIERNLNPKIMMMSNSLAMGDILRARQNMVKTQIG